VPVEEFDESHQRLLHLFVIREDLGTFAHEHPKQNAGGTFTLPFTFPSGGSFLVVADTAPRGAGSQVLSSRVTVDGEAGEHFDLAAAAQGDRGLHESRGDTTVDWELPSDPLPVGRSVRVVARFTGAGGRPVRDLEPYLGVLGHLMIVGEHGAFVHSHPDDRDGSSVNGEVPFLVRLPEPGLYRGWGQFQRGGEILTFDLVLRGAAGAG